MEKRLVHLLRAALIVLCQTAILSIFIFAADWQQTTTDEFSTAGSSTSSTRVINDSVQLAPKTDWWNAAWKYNRPITINNNSGSTLTDYQTLVEPFRDSGDFAGDNLNNNGLIGSWSFSEDQGQTIQDSSGSGNNGQLGSSSGVDTNDPAWIYGHLGNGLAFDGNDNYVNAGNSINLANSSFTLEAWARRKALASYHIIIGQGTASANNGLHFGFRNDNTFTLDFYASILSSPAYTDNDWHHWTATYDSSTNARKIYRDGILVASDTAAADYQGSGELSIGRRPFTDGTGYLYFNGLVDEVKIYSRVLAPEEISTRYGCGLAGSWHFSEGSGTSTSDMSGNNNNGSLTGTPSWVSGRFGNALSFDALADRVTVPNLDMNKFSVSAWVKRDSISAALNEILIISENSGGWGVAISTANKIMLTKTGSTSISSTGTLTNTTKWYYVVVTYDGTNARFYFDGALDSSPAYVETYSSTGNYTIGSRGSSSEYLKGSIDELKVYRRVLSASEIQAQYNSDAPKVKHDFSDVRFVSSNGTQAYNYYQETDTRFWVNIPSIAVSSNTIKIYYGNTATADSSSWGNTFAAAGTYAQEASADINTKRLWHMNENGGPTTADSSGNNDTGSLTGCTWVTGQLGASGIQFNGTSDFINMYLPRSAFGNTITVDAWIKPAADNTQRLIFAKNGPVIFYIDATNKLSGGIYSNGGAWTWVYGKTALSSTSWQHVTMSYNASKIVFYLNGVIDGSGAGPGAINSVDGPDYIGKDEWMTTYFKGIMDELRVCDIALDSSAIMKSAGVRKNSTVEPTHTSPGAESNTPYYSSGTFTSSVKDTLYDDTAIDSVAWTASGAGTINLKVRADNSDPAGWTDLSPAWSNDLANPDTSVTATGRYIQYKATFTGDGLTADPSLTDITLTYTISIVPPPDSVSCDKLTGTWYSTATFTFTNNTGFGVDINKYYYVWDNNASYSPFTQTESQWNSGALALDASSEGNWYFHYLPYSSTNTPGTAQDLGPFRYDGTAPAAPLLLLPPNNGSVSTSTTAFSWQSVTDISGINYTLQLDYYTFFGSPLVNKTGLLSESYTLSGSGQEKLIGSTTYYWRVIATDGAENTATSSYMKFNTTSSIPLVTNTMTGESYSTLQDAIDGANTTDGDVITVKDTLPHDENITITKDITLENAILAPSSGFAVTGQGSSGGEILRNCVITSGGISNLALGENLTVYDPTPAVATIQNSKLVNCLIESGTVIINSELENCYTGATADYFVDAAGGDFHLSTMAANAIDSGKNLSAEFAVDLDDAERGIDILEMPNFDSGAWDMGAYEFQITTGYINPPQAPSVPQVYFPADGTENLGTGVVLVWYPSTGSTPLEYEVHVSTSADMSNSYYDAAGITDTFAEITGLPYDSVFYWQVKASNDAGESAWSGVNAFSTQPAGGTENSTGAPSVPELSYPEDDAGGLGADIIFVWYPSTGAAPLTYTLELALSEDMSLVLYEIDSIENTFRQVNGLPYNTSFYWRVKAVNDAGESEWSGIRQFATSSETTITDDTLSTPVLSLPSDSAELADLPVTFQWYASSGTGSITYDFEISTAVDFVVVTAGYTNINGNTLVPSSVFDYNVNYYWRVRAHNESGYSAWSAVRAFVITQNGNSTVYSTVNYNGTTEPASSGTVRQKGGCFIEKLVRR